MLASPTLALLNIDNQVTFHEGGELPVAGAYANTANTITWINSNAAHIATIVSSLDSHVPGHIGFGEYWVNARGEHPEPFTRISLIQFYANIWMAADPDNQGWTGNYLSQLEAKAKHHTIWPHHAMIGTPGHDIVPELKEVIDTTALIYGFTAEYFRKGFVNKVEHYSIFEPDVKLPGVADAQRNVKLLENLRHFDRIYVVGQAQNFCVMESLGSMVRYYMNNDPDMLGCIVMLVDCMSPIQDPDAIKAMRAKFAVYRRLGVQFAKSTDPVV